ncbi:hypothetical protein Psuf_059450 [Phytohabitans suffuscus]|uniref:Uncharacterized protein n=1 Tax=Phytohabitans suffuscus TaxID=624315 RepID=A0A6F8YRA8_9ACTN|nr:hypothetical protein Psuf_059450 [Phytohabitans suffuscus]
MKPSIRSVTIVLIAGSSDSAIAGENFFCNGMRKSRCRPRSSLIIGDGMGNFAEYGKPAPGPSLVDDGNDSGVRAACLTSA